MRSIWGVPIIAVIVAAVSANTAWAGCCGAASYQHCGEGVCVLSAILSIWESDFQRLDPRS